MEQKERPAESVSWSRLLTPLYARFYPPEPGSRHNDEAAQIRPLSVPEYRFPGPGQLSSKFGPIGFHPVFAGLKRFKMLLNILKDRGRCQNIYREG
jgi:hypothetical protein